MDGKGGGDSEVPELSSSEVERGFGFESLNTSFLPTPCSESWQFAEQKNYNLKKQTTTTTNKKFPRVNQTKKGLLFCFKTVTAQSG